MDASYDLVIRGGTVADGTGNALREADVAIAGDRIAAVGEVKGKGVEEVDARGLLVTSDAHGRFHVACADIPNADRGSNFVMKLDERTLPTGYRLTTENPRDVRTTRGKLVKLNFGAAVHRVVRLEVSAAAFAPQGTVLLPAFDG